MDDKPSIIPLGVAGVVALLAVGAAFFFSQGSAEQKPEYVSNLPTTSRTDVPDDWRRTLIDAGIVREPIEGEEENYTAPRGLSSSDALARELFVTYAELRENGKVDATEATLALSALAEKRVAQFKAPTVYATSNLTIKSAVSIFEYERQVSQALAAADVVREYELNVFARAMSENRATELARLGTTSRVYRDIVKALLLIPVTEQLSADHLALVNGVSELESATSLMSMWGGDPVDALVLVGRFVDAEEYFSVSVENIYTLIAALKKRS